MKHAKGRGLREVVHENRARIAFQGGLACCALWIALAFFLFSDLSFVLSFSFSFSFWTLDLSLSFLFAFLSFALTRMIWCSLGDALSLVSFKLGPFWLVSGLLASQDLRVHESFGQYTQHTQDIQFKSKPSGNREFL